MAVFAAAADTLPDDEVTLLQYSAATKRKPLPDAAGVEDTPHSNCQNFCADDESFAFASVPGDSPVVKASPSQLGAVASEGVASTFSGSFLEQTVFLSLVGCLLRFLSISRGRCAEASRVKTAASARAKRFAASSPIEPTARPLVLPPATPQLADPSAALLRAAQAGDVAAIAEALRAGARLSAEDAWGCRALHFSARVGSPAAVKLLLGRGADADVREAWDETPLHLAAAAGHSEVCELLLDGGAAVNAANGSDQTPLFSATKAGHGETAGLLRAHGGVGGYVAPAVSSEGAGDEAE